MAQAQELLPTTSSASEEPSNSTGVLECAVCLESCIYPTKLRCNHIFCFLCVKGVANMSKKCPICRDEIPPDFFQNPQLIESIEEAKKVVEDNGENNEIFHWFYEGRNGWWQFDERNNSELENAYTEGKSSTELLIAGFLYVIDFVNMLQYRRNDQHRRRKIKRDKADIPDKKGVAGLKLNENKKVVLNPPVETDQSEIPMVTIPDTTIPTENAAPVQPDTSSSSLHQIIRPYPDYHQRQFQRRQRYFSNQNKTALL